uniref:Uncharacterized protein n=1 Tax=Cacopsylla melanoneura TaxID=428564 RepID=A0A8D9A0C6_9HEMI
MRNTKKNHKISEWQHLIFPHKMGLFGSEDMGLSGGNFRTNFSQGEAPYCWAAMKTQIAEKYLKLCTHGIFKDGGKYIVHGKNRHTAIFLIGSLFFFYVP